MTAEDFWTVILCAGAIAAPANMAFSDSAAGKLAWLAAGTFVLFGLVT